VSIIRHSCPQVNAFRPDQTRYNCGSFSSPMEVEFCPSEVSRVGLGGGRPEENVIVRRSRMKPEGCAGVGYVGAVGMGVGVV
jgi:hypothetical protein